MNRAVLKRQDLIHPDLSYTIVGCAYEVFNELGGGHHEKFYQRALAQVFESKKIPFRQQVYFPFKFQNKIIGKSFLDFIVYDKVVVELKKDNRFSKNHIDQVLGYLKSSQLQLAILINFTKETVVFKRLVNIKQ